MFASLRLETIRQAVLMAWRQPVFLSRLPSNTVLQFEHPASLQALTVAVERFSRLKSEERALMTDAIDSEGEYEPSSALMKTLRVSDATGVEATGLLARRRRRVTSPKAVFLTDEMVVILNG